MKGLLGLLTPLFAASCSFVPPSLNSIVEGKTVTASFKSSSSAVLESVSDSTLRVEVNLQESSPLPIRINYQVLGSLSARSSLDQSSAQGELVFAPGSTTEFIELRIVDDAIFEDTETIRITLSSDSPLVSFAQQEFELQITDDETPPVIEFSSIAQAASKSFEQEIVVEVQSSGEAGFDIELPLSFSGSTNISQLSAPTSLILPAGETSASLRIGLSNQSGSQLTENLVVELASPSRGTLGTNTQHNVELTQAALAEFNLCSAPSSDLGRGILIDPNGRSANYGNNNDCSFLIQPTGASYVELNSLAFQTHDSFDFLEVFDGTSEAAPSLGTFHSSSGPFRLRSSTGSMYLRWRTSASMTAPGFVLEWGSDSNAVRFGIRKRSLNIGESLNLEAYGGTRPYSLSLVDGVGTLMGNQYHSNTAGTARVRLTDALGQSDEIEISVLSQNLYVNQKLCRQSQSSDAFGRLLDNGGATGGISPQLNCGFLIQPPGATSITLSPALFDMFYTSYVMHVYDGTDATGNLLGRFAASDFVLPVTAYSGAMYIHVQTTNTNGWPEGFELFWTSTGSTPKFKTATRALELGDSVDLEVIGGRAPYTYTLLAGHGDLQATRFSADPSRGGRVHLRVTDALAQTDDLYLNVFNPDRLLPHKTCRNLGSQSATGRLLDSNGLAGAYANNEICNFLIQPPGNPSQIVLSPRLFDTLYNNEYMVIYDGSDNSGPVLGRFHVSDFTSPVIARSGSLYIEWRSANTNGSPPGFDLIWDSFSDVPELLVTKQQLNLGETIELQAIGGATPYSYAIISGGGSLQNNLFTAPMSPEDVVVRVTDSLMQSSDLRLRILDPNTLYLNRLCIDSTSTETNGRVADSGGLSGSLGNNQDCGFVIQPTAATRITLSAIAFDTESASEYIEIYQGTDSSGPLVARFAARDFTLPVSITGPAAYIRMVTANLNSSPPGFDLVWSAE